MPRKRSPQLQSYKHDSATAAAETEALAHHHRTLRQRRIRHLRMALEQVRVTLANPHLQQLAGELGCGEELRTAVGRIGEALAILAALDGQE